MSENQTPAPNSLLKRLLGPSRPQLSCNECFELLDQYVELEVAGASANETIPGMRAHLEGCPACSEDHGSLLALVQSDG